MNPQASRALLNQKRAQLKAARKESKKAAMRGRHNWGDFNRNQHIKELEREIQTLKATIGSTQT